MQGPSKGHLKRSVYVDSILGAAILTLSLTPFSVLGYAFTGAWAVLVFLMSLRPAQPPRPAILVFLFLMLWLKLQLFTNITHVDLVEFSKSYFQLFTSASALYAIWLAVHHYDINITYLSAVTILPTFFYMAIQVTELLIYGSTHSWFWFAEYSISTATSAERFQAVNLLSYTRPTAQYHEPSYLALVAFATCCFLADTASKYKPILILCSVATIIGSFSATVWILALGYYFLFFVSLRVKLLTCIPLSSLFFYYELSDFFRLSEMFEYGTSAWHRIGKPLLATKEALYNFPLGVPLGNTEFVYDNSILLLVSYFGVISMPLVAILAIIFFKKSSYQKPLYFLFVAMMVNGAIITIESTLLVGLVFMLKNKPNRSHQIS